MASQRIQINPDSIHLVLPTKKTVWTYLSIPITIVGFVLSIASPVWLYKNVIGPGIIPGYIIVLILGFWTLVMLGNIRSWIWFLAGKEILHFQNETLTIKRKNLLFYPTKTYGLSSIEQIGVCSEIEDGYNTFSWLKVARLMRTASIQFEYDDRVVWTGINLTDQEARAIFDALKEKQMMSEKQFRPKKIWTPPENNLSSADYWRPE
jgi:hypothetical protein